MITSNRVLEQSGMVRDGSEPSPVSSRKGGRFPRRFAVYPRDAQVSERRVVDPAALLKRSGSPPPASCAFG